MEKPTTGSLTHRLRRVWPSVIVLLLLSCNVFRFLLHPRERVDHFDFFSAGDMAKYLPDLKKVMDKKLSLELNGSRRVEGTLRGYDQFMNLVLDDTVEKSGDEDRKMGSTVIRGNSVVSMEILTERNI